MLPTGLLPNTHDPRDYDLIKTKKLGALPCTFKDEYNVDAKLWWPDQRAICYNFIPNIPPLPFGCTDYSQSDLMTDEDNQLYNPLDLDNITHANQNGGTDLRNALKAVTQLHGDKHPTYFNVQPQGNMDFFDAVRLAMAVATDEKRGVTVGTPWFPVFMSPADGILPHPDFTIKNYSWHNHVIKGWKTINGQVYLITKPWLGKNWGDGGFGYISRELFNALMNVSGSVAFTLDKLLPGQAPQKVDSSIIQLIVSIIRKALNL